jgi:hypothetical protein
MQDRPDGNILGAGRVVEEDRQRRSPDRKDFGDTIMSESCKKEDSSPAGNAGEESSGLIATSRREF